jgi:3-methyladenine DNA glycosylase Tag
MRLIDVNSSVDAKMLLDRIERTLKSECPQIPFLFSDKPPNVTCDDERIFDGLCRAVFSANATWEPIKENWEMVRSALCMLKVHAVAALSEKDLFLACNELASYLSQAMSPEDLCHKVRYVRDDAICLLRIAQKHGSFSALIGSFLIKDRLDNSIIDTAREAEVFMRFTDSNGEDKLRGVGLAIFCEFCKNIGIDEFKPDRHIKRFFQWINLLGGVGPEMDRPCRNLGIAIARAAGQPRTYVDSLIWNFCADKRGEICRKSGRGSKCKVCKLRSENPILCSGF